MATPVTTYNKSSSSILDYTLDWSDWLNTSESLSCSVWEVDTGLNSSSVTTTTSYSSVWLSQGTHGQEYDAKNTIWTDNNPQRKASRTIRLKVNDR